MIPKIIKSKFSNIFFTISLLSITTYAQEAQDVVNGNLIQFNDNGAWCWYQDERAVIDITGNKLILGSDASDDGLGGSAREGDVEAVIFDLQTGISQRVTLKDGASSPQTFYADDHNAPGFLVRPDGKYLSMYAAHFNDTTSHYRIYDSGVWGPEQIFNWKTEVPGGSNFQTTYSNLYYLSAEGRTYNFVRGNNKSPNFMISSDMGNTWSYGGQLTRNAGVGYNNGYYRYWGNGADRIDFIFTEYHPRDFNTSIYHGYIKDGKSYKSDGTFVDDIFDLSSIPTPEDFTLVFAANSILSGIKWTRCWNADVCRYNDGIIAAIIKARANDTNPPSNSPDNRLLYCRYNGSIWTTTYLSKAGPKLYSSEQDYTGLGAVHPNDPNTIYISTTFDPRDSTLDLGVHEIFKGVTSDNGLTWSWTPVTWNSTRGNLRPIIPAWDDDNTALLWWRGTYFSAQNYDAAIVGIIDRGSDNPGLMIYADANTTNTTLLDGSQLVTTGPDENAGADDDQWHIRTGYGNEGSIFTSSETGDGEDAPVLKTQINFEVAGIYDIWVNFWANPTADWRIKAGISQDNMQIFRHMACKQVESSNHKYPIVATGNNNTFLYQAYIGRVQLSSNSTLDVYVDDEARTGAQNSLTGNTVRTWYDGISYANTDGPTLPVELISFIAKLNDKVVELNWQTGTETNNRGFEVERYDDGSWRTIGFVKGKGTTTEISSYTFVDQNIVGTTAKYRLKQIDFNGLFTYSNVVEISVITNFELSQNYPNPFNPTTTITYTLPKDVHVSLKVYNLLGEEITTLVNKEMLAGIHNITWNAQNIPSGLYLYKIDADDYSDMKKMMLLR
jgi:hypothetical protein